MKKQKKWGIWFVSLAFIIVWGIGMLKLEMLQANARLFFSIMLFMIVSFVWQAERTLELEDTLEKQTDYMDRLR